MKKIVVTTDLSNGSKAGIRFAMQLQSQINCEIVFYHLVEISKPTSWSNTTYEKFSNGKIEENTAKLKQFVAKIYSAGKRIPAKCSYKVEVGLNAANKIIDFARKINAGYICLSTHGAGNISKIMGTHASKLITHAKTPLIVVPKRYRVKPITRIFYASDFSALGNEIKQLQAFAQPLQVKTKVVHYDYLLHVPENKAKLEAKAKKYIPENTAYTFKKRNMELSLSEHLREDIAKDRPSMVALFTKQDRSWFDKLFSNSQSKEMAFNAQVPLLVFRKG